MAETLWQGAQLHIADTLVRLDALRGRCPMTTVDPDTLERDPEVLKISAADSAAGLRSMPTWCAAEQCAWGMTSCSTVPTTHRGRDVSVVEQVRGTS